MLVPQLQLQINKQQQLQLRYEVATAVFLYLLWNDILAQGFLETFGEDGGFIGEFR